MLPRRVTFGPGERIEAKSGVYAIEPRAGSAVGWEIVEQPAPADVTVSPSGRYLIYGPYQRQSGAGSMPVWRLYDTQTGTRRDLPTRPGPFSPDESRYTLAGQDSISIVRVADGTVERVVPYSGAVPLGTWSPDGTTLLIVVGKPSGDGLPAPSPTPFGASIARVLRLIVATGEVKEIGEAVLAVAQWSPDGARYFVGSAVGGGITAYDAADDRVLWQLSPADLRAPVGVRGTEPYGYITLPRVAPGGSLAAVAVRGSGQPFYRVYVIDPRSGAIRFWVEGALTCGPHVWTADGRWLLVLGQRGGRDGAFLVASDGADVRFLAEQAEDLSPVDAGLAAAMTGEYGPGGVRLALRILSVPDGAVVREVPLTGAPAWDFAHDPLWLPDGRLVVTAPHAGHGGCGAGPPSQEQLTVRFPS